MRSEELCVKAGNVLAKLNFLREYIKFGQQNGSLKCVQPAVDTDADIVVFMTTFSVHTNGFHYFGQMVIIRETHAAVTVAAKGFCREK